MSKDKTAGIGWIAVGGGVALLVIVFALFLNSAGNQQLRASSPTTAPAKFQCECECAADIGGRPGLTILCTHRFGYTRACTDTTYGFNEDNEEDCAAHNRQLCRGYSYGNSRTIRGTLGACAIVVSPSPSPHSTP